VNPGLSAPRYPELKNTGSTNISGVGAFGPVAHKTSSAFSADWADAVALPSKAASQQTARRRALPNRYAAKNIVNSKMIFTAPQPTRQR
jgi:hypothetical protein